MGEVIILMCMCSLYKGPEISAPIPYLQKETRVVSRTSSHTAGCFEMKKMGLFTLGEQSVGILHVSFCNSRSTTLCVLHNACG